MATGGGSLRFCTITFFIGLFPKVPRPSFFPVPAISGSSARSNSPYQTAASFAPARNALVVLAYRALSGGMAMKRRAFIAALGGAAAWPVAARAQGRVWRVGVLLADREWRSAEEVPGGWR